MSTPTKPDQIAVENFTSPGTVRNVDRAKYEAMRHAYLAVVPSSAPGTTPADIRKAIQPHLSQQEFPDGAKSGWWAKCVQLDLEAKGVIRRASGSPVRLFKA